MKNNRRIPRNSYGFSAATGPDFTSAPTARDQRERVAIITEGDRRVICSGGEVEMVLDVRAMGDFS